MKRTQLTDLLANIKANFVSFFSIFMFVTLGVAVFLGISWAGPALQNAADKMFDEGSFHHFQIQFPYGLSSNDLEELAKVDGVSQIEAERQSFQTLHKDNRKYTVKVQSLGQDIDTPIVVEGELPTKSGEMAFHAAAAKDLGINVGDTITFEKDADQDNSQSSAGDESENSSGMKYLIRSSFTVTALVNNADYIAESSETFGFSSSPSGTVDGIAWVFGGVFDASAFQNGYPLVNVSCDSLAGIATFSDAYKHKSNEIKEPLEALGDALASERYDYLHGKAQKKIDEAEKQLEDGKKQIAEGEKKLENGKAELETKKAEGQAQLNDAYQMLISGEAEYSAGLEEYNTYRAAYEGIDALVSACRNQVNSYIDRKIQLDKDKAAGKITQEEYDKQFDALVAEVNAIIATARQLVPGLPDIVVTKANWDTIMPKAAEALSDYRNIQVEINGRAMTLNQAEQELNAASATLDAGRAELDDGWYQYDLGWAEYNTLVAEAEQMIAEGEKELAAAKKTVAENQPRLNAAKAQIADMVKYNWSVLPRAYNAGAGEVSTFSEVTGNLSISMAALFVIVGLLVSYFAVSRIVNEQITQIGTKKALGFRRREITTSYLWYSGIAVVVGGILGGIIGVTIVEGIIGSVLAGMFTFGPYPPYFGWGLFFIITAVELVLVLGATYLACRSILKEHAVELLRGPKPPEAKRHFYEKWGIWETLPLFIQTIVNNCVNDKRRVLSTIVGVAGCTALIVTAITLNNDVLKSYDRQYQNVYGFNDITYVDSKFEGAVEKAEQVFKQEDTMATQVLRKTYLLEQPNGESGMITVVVPVEEDTFSQLYHVNPTTDATFDLSGEGAWVTPAYAEHFGVKVGDTISVDAGDGKNHKIPILGFYEFWLTYHEMVIGKDYYEKEFEEVTPNVVLSNTGDIPVADFDKALSKIEGFDSIVNDAAKQHENFETFSSVSSAVVLIYLALAALMAIVVLLNLNVMFIDEKKRELIVLMINGFSVKDARHYISYDSIVLTAIGIIAGLILGCIMGSVTVASIEPSTAVFVKAPDLMAIVIGIVGSAALAIIMSLIALRRVNNFELTDINRF